uniref:Bulb-type lectin domain-containing protein n=1 Tax=Leersia perrieri TaxID=77586 RepID=A0A0D9XG24_9ORYZ
MSSSSLAILLLLMPLAAGAISVSPSYISRTNQQQIIATVAPAVADDAGQSALPFLTSPSGVYAAYLRRAADGSAAGAAACYVQIEQADAAGVDGGVLWESECTLVGGADACELAFSPVGLELFAGGHSLWDTGIDAEPATLSLDDGGDMRIVSQDGVTAWRATGEPWSGQMCGAAVPDSSSPPPLMTTTTTGSAKLLTPPASSSTLAAGDLSFGDQIAPPADTLPTSPDQPPADTMPNQPLLSPPPPPPQPATDATPFSPELPMPPPPVDTYPVSPPDQPLYSSPPPMAFVPHTPLAPIDVPPLSPPSSAGALPPAPAGVVPHQHVPPPHHLPLGASPAPAADAMAPSGGHGAAFGQGQQQQGAFGQHQVLNGGEQPLDESSGERPRMVDTAIAGLVGVLIALCF